MWCIHIHSYQYVRVRILSLRVPRSSISQKLTSDFFVQVCSPNAWKSHNSEQTRARKRPHPDDGPSVTKFFKTEKVDRSELITHAISKYIIKSMRPISEVENEGFVEMWQEVE